MKFEFINVSDPQSQ